MPKGRTVGRAGARPGDVVMVTGAIGDGWLGLQAAQGKLSLEMERIIALVEHYRRPMPQTDFASTIRDMASASVDVSDGLVADLGHIASASGVGLEIDLEVTPLSLAGQAWMDQRVDAQAALEKLVTGGDDYEIAFTAPASSEEALRREADRRHIPLTRIGQVVAGKGVAVRYQGQAVTLAKPGFTHS